MSICQKMIIVLFSLCCFTVSAQTATPANNGKTAPAKMTVKPHHADFMATDGVADCQACHDSKTPVSAPDDNICLTCHGTRDELAAMTEPEATSGHPEPNPHNSIHYGKDVPCSVCHSEHKKSELYCNNCHMFEFPNMKP